MSLSCGTVWHSPQPIVFRHLKSGAPARPSPHLGGGFTCRPFPIHFQVWSAHPRHRKFRTICGGRFSVPKDVISASPFLRSDTLSNNPFRRQRSAFPPSHFFFSPELSFLLRSPSVSSTSPSPQSGGRPFTFRRPASPTTALFFVLPFLLPCLWFPVPPSSLPRLFPSHHDSSPRLPRSSFRHPRVSGPLSLLSLQHSVCTPRHSVLSPSFPVPPPFARNLPFSLSFFSVLLFLTIYSIFFFLFYRIK